MASQLTEDPHERAHLTAVAGMASAYAAFLLSTPTSLRPPKLALELPPHGSILPDLAHEAQRLDQLYDQALQHTGGTALVQWIHAYHAAANFDGLRVLLWLARAIAAIDTTATVDSRLRELRGSLQFSLDAAVGRGGERRHTPELYGALQQVSDALHRLVPVEQAPLDRTDEFTLQVHL